MKSKNSKNSGGRKPKKLETSLSFDQMIDGLLKVDPEQLKKRVAKSKKTTKYKDEGKK
jgi:hypothetical protein